MVRHISFATPLAWTNSNRTLRNTCFHPVSNRKLFDELRIDLGELPDMADALRSQGQTVMFAAVDSRPAGLLGVADPIKQAAGQDAT